MGLGPLHGLRVVDLTDDSGRLAPKLLAELGASVRRGGTIDSSRFGRWYDAGKVAVEVSSGDELVSLAADADLVFETMAPGAFPYDAVRARNPRVVVVSLTPFGQTGPWAAWHTSDLVSAALGGVLSVSGTADRAQNPYGRQSYHVGSMVAVVCGLAAVRQAARTGRGQRVDLSLHEAVVTTLEQIWFQYWFDDVLPYAKVAPRRGSLHWLGAYAVTAARDGWIMTCPSPTPPFLVEWLAEEGVAGASELLGLDSAAVSEQIEKVMAMMASFAASRPKGELFREAQRRHIAWGEVQSIAQVATNPQHAHRDFFQEVKGPTKTIRPRLPIVFHGTPLPPLLPPGEAHDGGQRVVDARPPVAASGGRPLEGLRVLDLTWVLAGPFCCRMLGDLGADIVKVQTAERATLVNDPAYPYYYCWNRSKRSVTLNMKHPDALAIARRLIEQSDVLIENYSAGVLARWGLDYDTVREWNPRLVYVTMSGCGHDGPWREMITYAPSIHALCGLTHLSNPPDRGDVGPGFSLNDHAAGLMGAVAVLSALTAREHTNSGQHIDISQFEVGSYLVGAALTDFINDGREAAPSGNRDPFADHVVNDVYACLTGEVAVTVEAAQAEVLAAVIGGSGRDDEALAVARWCATRSATEVMTTLQAIGIAAGRVQNAEDLTERDEQLESRGLLGTFEHAGFGRRPFDRFPGLFSDADLRPYRPAPSYLGEHNFEVLTDLAGLSEEEIAVGMGNGLFQ